MTYQILFLKGITMKNTLKHTLIMLLMIGSSMLQATETLTKEYAADTWHMLSFPCNDKEVNVKEYFGLQGEENKDWVVYVYKNGTGYERYNGLLKKGEGYWVTQVKKSFFVELYPLCENPTPKFYTTIKKGWNLIGTGSDRTITVNDIKENHGTQSVEKVWVYRDDEYTKLSGEDIIDIGEAYFIKTQKESVDLSIGKGEDGNYPSSQPLTREELMKLIENWKKDPSQANKLMIENANVSEITDMSDMFMEVGGYFDLSRWDVSNVTNMNGMFIACNFESMGCGHTIPENIENWDVSNVTDMSWMFSDSSFNKPLGNWDVSNVTNMSGMFYGVTYNQPLASWDVSSVTNMSSMFGYANVTTPYRGEGYDYDISNWDVSQVTEHDGFSADVPGLSSPTLTDLHNPFSITTTALNRWYNFTPQNYTRWGIIFKFRSTPLGNNINTVIGFSSGEANKYQDLGIIVRFAPNGKIDVRNGSSYEADTSVSYEANRAYRFKIDVNVDKKTYSVYLFDRLIAKDYSFRTEQSSLNSVNNMAIFSRRNAGVILGETAIK